MRENSKFWNCLKTLANLFDFEIVIKFIDGKIVDFDIVHINESEVNVDEA